jgi:hypothetical protein
LKRIQFLGGLLMNPLNETALEVARRADWNVEDIEVYRQRYTATLARDGQESIRVVIRVTSNWNVLASVDMETGEFSGHSGVSHILFASKRLKADNDVSVYLIPTSVMEDAFKIDALPWMIQGKYKTSTVFMGEYRGKNNIRYGFERKWEKFKIGETISIKKPGNNDVIAKAKNMIAAHYGVSVTAITINVAL